MAVVTIPPEFFRGELRIYADWREALARELLQNAVDANPTRIDVSFADIDGETRLTFSDDGVGMTRTVLEEVFFALGKTTKTGPDTVGGFGRARIITCFAQRAYQIRTGNLLVTGTGGEYTITEVPEYRKGCEFVIDLVDDDSGRVRRSFERILRTCTLTVPVRIDGSIAETRALQARATRVLRDTNGDPWARVYVQPDRIGSMIVRVHGLAMFHQWLNGNDDVIVELLPRRSRDVLSASRDQLKGEFGEQIEKFKSDLTRNRRQALRPADTPLDMWVGGGGFLATDAPNVVNENTDSEPASALSSTGRQVAVTADNMAALTNARAQAPAGELTLDFGTPLPDPPSSTVGFDVYMMADTSDTRVRKLARAWDPTGWDATTGIRRRAVLLAWKAAVSYAMDVLVTTNPSLGRVLWTVGWTFDTHSQAVHRAVGSGHVLALNPVDDEGRSKYRPTLRANRIKMLAIAAHEAVHVAVDGHDEQFASLLTELFAHMDPAAADKAIREAATRV